MPRPNAWPTGLAGRMFGAGSDVQQRGLGAAAAAAITAKSPKPEKIKGNSLHNSKDLPPAIHRRQVLRGFPLYRPQNA